MRYLAAGVETNSKRLLRQSVRSPEPSRKTKRMKKSSPNPDDVLRRMLSTPPKPKQKKAKPEPIKWPKKSGKR